ncbi:MAG: hypothetical protein MHMPM18_000091 [Marteilia pararefringens]
MMTIDDSKVGRDNYRSVVLENDSDNVRFLANLHQKAAQAARENSGSGAAPKSLKQLLANPSGSPQEMLIGYLRSPDICASPNDYCQSTVEKNFSQLLEGLKIEDLMKDVFEKLPLQSQIDLTSLFLRLSITNYVLKMSYLTEVSTKHRGIMKAAISNIKYFN